MNSGMLTGRSGMGSTSASAKVNSTGNTVDHVLKTKWVRFPL